MPYGYDDALARRMADAPAANMSGGSGYFATRDAGLDPALFEGDRLRLSVRSLVLHTLFNYMSRIVPHPERFVTVWIAGSGATTAWNADREAGGAPGDLDCLLGVDYDPLRTAMPVFQGSSDEAIAHELNQRLHDDLWPSIDHTRINGAVYELTYYVNNGVGAGPDDILAINPYAAYNVTGSHWSQPPVDVPDNFSDTYFSDADREVVKSDKERAIKIRADFNGFRKLAEGYDDGSPTKINVLTKLHQVVRMGSTLFDEIHDNRHSAFGPGGEGYFDRANYRWQAGKGNGTITVARQLKQLDEGAHKDIGLGGDCTNTEHLLLLGAMSNGG